MKDLTPEMEKQVKFILRVVGDLEVVDDFIGMTKEQVLEQKTLEAMHSIRKEAQLELIEEMRKKVEPMFAIIPPDGIANQWYVDKQSIIDLLTTKEESLKEEV